MTLPAFASHRRRVGAGSSAVRSPAVIDTLPGRVGAGLARACAALHHGFAGL